MDRYSKTTIALLIVFIIATISGCGEDSSSSQAQDYADYEDVNYWTLSNDSSKISIDDSKSFEGSYSVKIVNNSCANIKLKNVFPVESNQTYEISIALLRHAKEKNKAGVTIELDNVEIETDATNSAWSDTEDTTSAWVVTDDRFSVIVTQSEETILSETATIDEDDIWETKTFSFRSESDEPIDFLFVPSCGLQLFWLDSFSIKPVSGD